MNSVPTADNGDEDLAATTAYDTSEIMRQVFLRVLSVPPPVCRRDVDPPADPSGT
ncbi:hypothetical protein GCM10010341_55660 [Streptomyces noursei]|nr:hypothetical protein GCM10010341_55660 [Streptomyces noursei]